MNLKVTASQGTKFNFGFLHTFLLSLFLCGYFSDSFGSNACNAPLSIVIPWKDLPKKTVFWNGKIITDPSVAFRGDTEDGFLDCLYQREFPQQSFWQRFQLPTESANKTTALPKLLPLFESESTAGLLLSEISLSKISEQMSPSSAKARDLSAKEICHLRLSQRSFNIPCSIDLSSKMLNVYFSKSTIEHLRWSLGNDPNFDDPFLPQTGSVHYQPSRTKIRLSEQISIVLSNRRPELAYFSDKDGWCRLLAWDPDFNHLSIELTQSPNLPDQKQNATVFSSRKISSDQPLEAKLKMRNGHRCSALVSDGTHLLNFLPSKETLTWGQASKIALDQNFLFLKNKTSPKFFSQLTPLSLLQAWNPEQINLSDFKDRLLGQTLSCTGTSDDCTKISRTLGLRWPKSDLLSTWQSPVVSVLLNEPFFQILYFEVQLK